jgi:hypothetical protein
LQQLYRTEGYVPKVPEKNSIGVTGYLEQYANEVDLKLFYEDQLPEAVNSTFKLVSINGSWTTFSNLMVTLTRASSRWLKRPRSQRSGLRGQP